ncbi:hypothetical protein ACLOJK_006090 [Asimina triloba]
MAAGEIWSCSYSMMKGATREIDAPMPILVKCEQAGTGGRQFRCERFVVIDFLSSPPGSSSPTAGGGNRGSASNDVVTQVVFVAFITFLRIGGKR